MGSTVFVKVVGFRDVERHALNTLFRVSAEQPTCYALWTPESPVMPHIALIDVESYEAGMALASPGLNRNLKLICVGNGAPKRAWRVFPRPINWSAILRSMDLLFAPVGVDIDLDPDGGATTMSPPGVRHTLLVEPVARRSPVPAGPPVACRIDRRRRGRFGRRRRRSSCAKASTTMS